MKDELVSLFNKENSQIQKPLFVFDLANNHNGDINHGLKIIREVAEACKEFKDSFIFGFKFQYRNLDTFIHPNYKDRKDIKYVKRFSETRLAEEEFMLMKEEIEKLGFISVCTPFDEKSVDLIEKHNFDILKIASCSFTDWPLLERVIQTNLPIIASTSGASLEEVDKVVLFFEHRNKRFIIMHCVGEYPTKKENLQLNQIDLFKKRYPELTIGFSTHEEPDNTDSIKIAVSKGAGVFERHVDVKSDKYTINAYSSTPLQINKWLQAAKDAYKMQGLENTRYPGTEKEKSDLNGLKRGVFAKAELKKGDKLGNENIFYAIPWSEGQLAANDLSKYTECMLKEGIKVNEALNFNNLEIRNIRTNVLEIIKKLKEIIIKSNIALPNKLDLELSHHYGIERYEEYGAAILSCINREYCKKLIILLPGQKHPSHYHVKKEETFNVLYGDIKISIDGREELLKAGDILTIERKANHSFSSENGCVFEEVSTTHYKDDSFYEDEQVEKNKDRKTYMTFWSDWLHKEIT